MCSCHRVRAVVEEAEEDGGVGEESGARDSQPRRQPVVRHYSSFRRVVRRGSTLLHTHGSISRIRQAVPSPAAGSHASPGVDGGVELRNGRPPGDHADHWVARAEGDETYGQRRTVGGTSTVDTVVDVDVHCDNGLDVFDSRL